MPRTTPRTELDEKRDKGRNDNVNPEAVKYVDVKVAETNTENSEDDKDHNGGVGKVEEELLAD
jgi:hypothetical protein